MNVALIFPPLADPTQPYSSLPVLAAYLKQHGWQNIRQMDLNIEFVRDVLRPEPLAERIQRLQTRLSHLEGQASLTAAEAVEYALLVKAALKAPFVTAGIEAAVTAMHARECFKDLGCLNQHKRTIQEAMEILSAAAYPLQLSFARMTGPDLNSPASLQQWIDAEGLNPYQAFVESVALPRLSQSPPDVVGISLTYRSQVLAAFTLAAAIKARWPRVPVICGGNMISLWYDVLERCPELFQWVDFFIAFEGESALHELLEALAGDRPVSQVPNLVYPTSTGIRKNPVLLEDIDRLPTPDYGDLPLDRYLCPEPVFLLYTSRGCYWSRCRFCSVSAAMRRGFRQRHVDLVCNDIRRLKERHQARYISFVDDAVAPAVLAGLAARLAAEGPEIFWQCEIRFEEALDLPLLKKMRAAGCLNLIFGLESYSARVLALMHKGTRPACIERIVGDCRRAGIAFNLQFFFGFPGETRVDALQTAAFARQQAHGAATFSFGLFELQKGSAVEKDPGAYGLTTVDRTAGPLAIRFDYLPQSAHAAEIRTELRAALRRKMPYPYAGLSINAHTLVHLHLAGKAALGSLYRQEAGVQARRVPDQRDLLDIPLRTSKTRSLGTFRHSADGIDIEPATDAPAQTSRILLYDYLQDRVAEVSPLVAWLLSRLDDATTPRQLADRLAAELDQPKSVVYRQVQAAIQELTRNGLIVCGLTQ